ncbi:hypothetical protein JHN46_46915, partial [Streptomyces sp. MBT33]|nr:hypothetical protein [Streptomyces sp. MBT33]
RIGRARAKDLLAQASHTADLRRIPLLEVLRTLPDVTAHHSVEELEQLLDPTAYVGDAPALTARALDTAVPARTPPPTVTPTP